MPRTGSKFIRLYFANKLFNLSNQFHSCFKLTRAAIQICSGSAYAAMTGKRFQYMDGSAFVGKVC